LGVVVGTRRNSLPSVISLVGVSMPFLARGELRSFVGHEQKGKEKKSVCDDHKKNEMGKSWGMRAKRHTRTLKNGLGEKRQRGERS
jgi:hypothetical protein